MLSNLPEDGLENDLQSDFQTINTHFTHSLEFNRYLHVNCLKWQKENLQTLPVFRIWFTAQGQIYSVYSITPHQIARRLVSNACLFVYFFGCLFVCLSYGISVSVCSWFFFSSAYPAFRRRKVNQFRTIGICNELVIKENSNAYCLRAIQVSWTGYQRQDKIPDLKEFSLSRWANRNQSVRNSILMRQWNCLFILCWHSFQSYHAFSFTLCMRCVRFKSVFAGNEPTKPDTVKSCSQQHYYLLWALAILSTGTLQQK